MSCEFVMCGPEGVRPCGLKALYKDNLGIKYCPVHRLEQMFIIQETLALGCDFVDDEDSGRCGLPLKWFNKSTNTLLCHYHSSGYNMVDMVQIPKVEIIRKRTNDPTVSATVPEEAVGGKRDPVQFRYDLLNWDFLECMAQIAAYASTKYDDTPQQSWGELNYQQHELVGDKSSLNHLPHHYHQYITGQPYDKFDEDPRWHLVAIAYNAMMLFYHHERRRKEAKIVEEQNNKSEA